MGWIVSLVTDIQIKKPATAKTVENLIFNKEFFYLSIKTKDLVLATDKNILKRGM